MARAPRPASRGRRIAARTPRRVRLRAPHYPITGGRWAAGRRPKPADAPRTADPAAEPTRAVRGSRRIGRHTARRAAPGRRSRDRRACLITTARVFRLAVSKCVVLSSVCTVGRSGKPETGLVRDMCRHPFDLLMELDTQHIRLDCAALHLARDVYPKIDVPRYLGLLDELAAAVARRSSASSACPATRTTTTRRTTAISTAYSTPASESPSVSASSGSRLRAA